MLAALQGRTPSPSHLNPYFGLHNPRITSRCAHIQSCIDVLTLKELHEFFPNLLANIFGYDNSPGWQLRGFSARLHSDFNVLLQFFSTDGSLFRLIGKLESAHTLYEFPISCLPTPTQLSLSEGHVPALYTDKVDHSSPTKVLLTPFEYYIFHFAYYLIFMHNKPQSPLSLPPLQDSLYSHLLDHYLNHFLPPLGTLPPALTTTSQRQGSPHSHSNTPPGILSHHHSPGLLKTNGDVESHVVSMGTTGDQREAPLVQAEVIVQVLIEFWLNQNNYNGRHGDILAQAQNRFTPNEEHLLLIRRLMKHVHYFSNGSSFTSTYTTLIPITDALRRCVIPMFVQKRLYYFLRYSFRHLPLDNTFRFILELWLTFIQPWRYIDPLKPSSENKESLETIPRKWRGFVLENFPFFSTLLMEIIGRSFQMDLTSDPGTTLLYRVTKVFSQRGLDLMGFIKYGESLLLNPDPSSVSPHSSPVVDACSLKALFMELDGPLFNYQSLFNEDTLTAIQMLLDKVREARIIVTSRQASKGGVLPSHHTSTIPSPPITPITTTAPLHHTKRSWWQSVGSLFSDNVGPSSFHHAMAPAFSSLPPSIIDYSKTLSLLENTESYIMIMFGLSSPPQYSPSDGSPQWKPSLQTSVTPLRLVPSPSHAQSESPKSLEPEYIRGTSQLTPRGKMQLINGIRKSSNLNVPYMGDPLLQPIRSYENTTLVRYLHSCSTFLNEKFAIELQSIGVSDRILSRIAKYFLSPPILSPYYYTTGADELPHTPKSKVSHVLTVPPPHLTTTTTIHNTSLSPRFNLRPLASYYNLTCIGLSMILLWLLLIPLWVMMVLMCLLVCGGCVCSRKGRRKTL